MPRVGFSGIPSHDKSKHFPPTLPTSELQAGSSTTATDGTKSITFDEEFSAIPKVFVQPRDADAKGIVIDITSVSTTGFSVKARKVTGVDSDSKGSHKHVSFKTGDLITGLTLVDGVPIAHGDGTEAFRHLGCGDDPANKTVNTDEAGSHFHSTSAPTLQVDFDWLAIKV